MREDEETKLAILKALYEIYEEDPRRGTEGESLLESLDSVDSTDFEYLVSRMDGRYLENKSYVGRKVGRVSIKAAGIDELHNAGVETFLQSDIRYEMLGFMYEQDRERGGSAAFSLDSLGDQLGHDETTLLRNLRYLAGKGLVQNEGGRWDYIKLTSHGAELHENHVENGAEIPPASEATSLNQTIIGPNEREEARQYFRDAVELAEDTVEVIDPFAREGVYEMLGSSVDESVAIRVLTSDEVIDDDYPRMVEEAIGDHEIEVRYLPRRSEDWEIHDRFLSKDRERGWHWGTSFHDAGEDLTGITDLRPVNLRTTLDLFDESWEKAETGVSLGT